MNISELHALIGKTAILTTLSEHLNVRVIVKDARAVFGRTDALVQADIGSFAWVTLDRLVIDQ